MSSVANNNYINGEFVESSEFIENVNPSDISQIIGQYGQADLAQFESAIGAASAAFPTWSRSTSQMRADALDFVGNELLARREELGNLLSSEEGKRLAEGVSEVVRAGQIFKFFAGEALRNSGDAIASTRAGVDVKVIREPLGVVGIITPWNFPIAIPAWKIAPALAFGNCVLFKPATDVPASAWALSEIISRAGLPDGVFNLVMAPGRVAGRALTESPLVAGISLTGSVGVGRKLAVDCAASFKKVQLEMGGKNPLVVLDDADLPTAVECAVNGAYFSTGQRCTASSRLIVTKGVHDQFVEAVKQRIEALNIGHALARETDIGPVANASQLTQNMNYVGVGVAEGATLLCGGERLERSTQGHYMSPALFVNGRADMRISQEEIFGPVAVVIEAEDADEALALANDSEFGLSAGVCTSSLFEARRFQRDLKAGMVMVNVPTAGVDYHVPFGGTKGSSYGSREQGRYAAEFYTTVKTTYLSSPG